MSVCPMSIEVFGSVNTHKHAWRRRVLKTKISGQTYSLSVSPVLPKTTCVWWSMEILCTAVNSWREPLWVVCAPSWNDRSRVWSIWNKVQRREDVLQLEGFTETFVASHCSNVSIRFSLYKYCQVDFFVVFVSLFWHLNLSVLMSENNLLLSLFDSSSASVPFAVDWPEHQDPAAVWLPQRRQVQFHQQGKCFSQIIR